MFRCLFGVLERKQGLVRAVPERMLIDSFCEHLLRPVYYATWKVATFHTFARIEPNFLDDRSQKLLIWLYIRAIDSVLLLKMKISLQLNILFHWAILSQKLWASLYGVIDLPSLRLKLNLRSLVVNFKLFVLNHGRRRDVLRRIIVIHHRLVQLKISNRNRLGIYKELFISYCRVTVLLGRV